MRIRANPPIHPGEILRDEFMVPLTLSAGKIAKAVGVPRSRIERLAREETALTADTAARLGRYFKTSAEFWLNLQRGYELDCLLADKTRLAALDAIVPLERPDLEGEVA